MKIFGSNDKYLLEMISKINLIAFPYEYYLYVEENYPYFDLQLYNITEHLFAKDKYKFSMNLEVGNLEFSKIIRNLIKKDLFELKNKFSVIYCEYKNKFKIEFNDFKFKPDIKLEIVNSGLYIVGYFKAIDVYTKKINDFACYKQYESKIDKEIQAHEVINYIIEHEIDENFIFDNKRIFDPHSPKIRQNLYA